MTLIAPHIEAFLRENLGSSQNHVGSWSSSFPAMR